MAKKGKTIPIISTDPTSIINELERFEKKLEEIQDFIYSKKISEENWRIQFDGMERLPALFVKVQELRILKAQAEEIRGAGELSLLDQ